METSPNVTANAVILQYSEQRIHLTLTKAGRGLWSLPEVPVSGNETSLAALENNLRQTIGLKDREISYREQLYTTERLTKSTNTLCVSYLYLSRGASWHKGSQQIGLFSISKLPRLSKQDGDTIHYALERLHAKALYSTILSHLLPRRFSFLELQQLFETATGQKVDRRNFRKKMLTLNVLGEQGSRNESKNADVWQFSFRDQKGIVLYDRPFLPPTARKSSNT